jgi:hypothetical protein
MKDTRGGGSSLRPGLSTLSGRISPAALQICACCFIAAAAVLYAFQGMWDRGALLLYLGTGLLAAAVSVCCLLSGRLYRQHDIRFLLLFLVYAFLSSAFVYGLTIHFFVSRFFCVWAVLFAAYCVILVVPEPKKLFFCYTLFSALSLSAMCLLVLTHASRSLLMRYPAQDLARGCFRVGRLCGLGNANYFGFACFSLLTVSLFGLLHSSARVRFLYLFAAGTGWFCLGLANCRTAIVGFSFALALFSFVTLRKSAARFRSRPLFLFVLAVLPLLVLIISLFSFYLPLPLYRLVMSLLNRSAGNPHLENNLTALVSRDLIADGDTFSDRVLIWTNCLRSCFKNSRRALLGITRLSRDAIGAVYAGRHDIQTPHAHNACLELLRRYGLIGLAILLPLFFLWCREGIRRLFSDEPQGICFFLCCAAGMLLMSVSEPVPLAYDAPCYLDIPFLLACGYCVRAGRSRR